MLTATHAETLHDRLDEPASTPPPAGAVCLALTRASARVPDGCEPNELAIGEGGARARWTSGEDRYVTVRLMPTTAGWRVMPIGNLCHWSLGLLTKAATWSAAMVDQLDT